MQQIAEVKRIQQKTEVVFVCFKFVDIWLQENGVYFSQCKYEISSVSLSFMLTCLNFWLHAPGSTWKDRCTQGLKQQKLISEKIKLPSTKNPL